MTANDFLRLLATKGGYIVSSADCDALQIAAAQVEKRMFIDDGGLGFIHIPKKVSIPGKNNPPHEQR